jgi:hypothetical protein
MEKKLNWGDDNSQIQLFGKRGLEKGDTHQY